ncbi:hypothetical protein PUMCH_004359 [Australozyma saopauloensis]|uniref:Glycoside hydrolase family 5 domain-containing protein n=1 Tax=Australozyma saopauloensis TaxID=291208 RepID=A0AAX4HET1_9ASCO|nr:hypothetical protein PUMCH_004359 [[Candida] saopauloensis]
MKDPINPSEELSDKEFIRYRTNFGVNLAACFVRARWMFPGSVISPEFNTELQSLRSEVNSWGRDGARDFLEKFWRGFMTDDDWKWIQSKGMNSVRVPIGYWNIDGGNFTEGTKFAEFADIYRNSWQIFKSHFIEAAARFNISVLVDVHALPGGANLLSLSGEDETAEFWNDEKKQDLMVEAVRFIARDLKNYANITGIQIVNEAAYNAFKGQTRYYEKAMRAIREEDNSIPVVISDAFDPMKYSQWVQEIQGNKQNFGLIVDFHCYRDINEADRKKSVRQIIDDLDYDFVETSNGNSNDVDFMLGEYFCRLSEESWQLSGLDYQATNERRKLAAEFGRKQIELAVKRTSAAIYFFNYKFEFPLGEMDARDMFEGYLKTPSVSMPPEGLFEKLRDEAYDMHVAFWTQQGFHYDFEIYKVGFEAGWSDCSGFAERGAMIGRRQALKFARKQEYVQKKGDLEFIWQFDHGYDKALFEFRSRFYKT